MRNIRIVLSYDGTAYCGWERQRDYPTVQQTLEEAIRSLTGEPVSVIASGRTDAGVHAIGQVANFHTSTRHDCATIQRALNALLPVDIRVVAVGEAAESFHSTYDAKGKLYRYVIQDGPVMDPFLRRYAVHCNWPMDVTAMHQAAQCLRGTHDFCSFETSGSPRNSSVRTISLIAVLRDSAERIWAPEFRTPKSEVRSQNAEMTDQSRRAGTIHDPSGPLSSPFLFFEVAADGFLYNMVRAMAGTLINVGRGYWPAESVPQILESHDRTRAGPTAPAHGLFLVRVDY